MKKKLPKKSESTKQIVCLTLNAKQMNKIEKVKKRLKLKYMSEAIRHCIEDFILH